MVQIILDMPNYSIHIPPGKGRINRNTMNVTRRKFVQASFFIGFAITTKKGWANKLPKLVIERRDLFFRVWHRVTRQPTV